MPAAVSRMRIAGPAFSSSGAALPPRARARSAVPRRRSIRLRGGRRGGRRISRLCRGSGARLPPPPFALRADPGIDKGLDTSRICADGRRPPSPRRQWGRPPPRPRLAGPVGGCAYRAPPPPAAPRACLGALGADCPRLECARRCRGWGRRGMCAGGQVRPPGMQTALRAPFSLPPLPRPLQNLPGRPSEAPQPPSRHAPRQPAPCPRLLPPPVHACRGPITCGTEGGRGTPTPRTAARAHRSGLSPRLRVARGGSHWAP